MSGRLGGLKGAVRQEQPESYEPGRPHEFQAIIDSLAREYEDGTLQKMIIDYNWEAGLERVVRHLTPALMPLAGRPDAVDSFLDCLSMAACGKGESLECLLDPVVQALYTLGHNSFTLDLSYHHLGGTDLASGMMSVLPDNDLLALSIKAVDVGYFGWLARFCDLTLIGDCRELGPSSVSSTIRLRGEAAGNIGLRAENTDFYVASLGTARVCPLAAGCRVYTLDLGEGDIPMGFAKDGNWLYLPDGKGGWQEVRQ